MADIIFDVDGTLMNITHRRHYVTSRPKNFPAFRAATKDDTPIPHVFDMAKMLKAAGHRIIISSGRNRSDQAITTQQLRGQGLMFDALYMRENGDNQPDDKLKEKMLAQMREDGYDPTIAYDDRNRVVDMWRKNGLKVHQVVSREEGDF